MNAKLTIFWTHRSALPYSKLLTFIRCSLAFLLQSTPLTSFGTRNSVANFSVSVSAASNARKHFRTGSKNTSVYYSVDTAQRLIFDIYHSWAIYIIIYKASLPARADLPDSADTLVESDGVGEVDAEVATLVAIITSWLPCWGAKYIGAVVATVFPPVRDEDEIDSPPGGFIGTRGGPPEATRTTYQNKYTTL